MMQRLGSWIPFSRRRAASVLVCASLFARGMIAAQPYAHAAFRDQTSASPGFQDQTDASRNSQDQAKDKAAPVRLEPGTPIEKELAGGATDAYEIQVGAGQFLHAVVNQIGIDVALILYDPDGKKIGDMDSLNGTSGPEKISMIAESSGIYQLVISSGDKSASTGRYRVTINPLRVPTDADRARVLAEFTYREADKLNAQRTSDSMRLAIQEYETAMSLWQAAGDSYEVALTATAIGEMYLMTSGYDKAIRYFDQALQFHHAAGNRDEEAMMLTDIALAYHQMGDTERALDYGNQVLPIARIVGDRELQATTLNNMGGLYDDLGDKQKAIECLTQALQLARAIGKPYIEAWALNNTGRLYDSLGDEQKALEYYKQTVAIERAMGSPQGGVTSLNNIGRLYNTLGDRQKALEYDGQSLSLARAVGDKHGEAVALRNFAQVHESLGQPQKALEYLESSLAIERTLGERRLEGIILNDIGSVQELMGRFDVALGSFSQALAFSREVQSPLAEAGVYRNLMILWRDNGQPTTGVFFGKQAVNKIQHMRGNIRSFEKETQRSFIKSKEKVYRELADLLIAQGRLPEAEQVLDLLKNEEYFEFIRRDTKESSSPTAAANLTTSEETVNREYEANADRVTAIGNEYATLRAKPSRTAEEEQHLKELSERVTVANQTWEKFLSDLHAELGKTKEAQQSVENLEEGASAMKRVVRELGPGTVALYTLVGEEKYHIIVVAPTVTVARDYPITAEELGKKVAEFRRVLMDPASDPLPKARELYTILVGPIEKQLEGAKAVTLMWSLDGVLRYLPMAALHDGRRYLVEKYRNTVFTPASIPSLTERTKVAAWQGLGMGLSKAYGGFVALPAVPGELHRIIHETKDNRGDGVVPGRVMLDESFTQENMEKALEKKYSLVHIASHFDFSPGNETQSFLLLGGKDEKGERLSLSDLRTNPAFSFNDTQLLTLSACSTAVSGGQGDGREVDGLGFLAQHKGAHAVIASLWGVYDQSTGALMEQFYKLWTEHRNMPKAEALREAQLALLRGDNKSNKSPQSPRAVGSPPNAAQQAEYAHPYYWAPFILIGNWR